jgi:predicted Zn-dependent peptidase
MIEEIQQSRFDNGLTILTDKMPHVRSVTLGFFFRAGARHEPVDLNGISHFIEHTVFKGTTSRTALQIAIEQDRLGGNLDAFTTHEETGFAIKVIDDQLPAAFDLIADILTNARFEKDDLKSEQKVIIEEMKMIDDSPEEFLGDLFNGAFFPDHPLGRSIAGTPATVKTFNPDNTRRYHRQVFNASNLVIAAAGNVEHEKIVDLAQAALCSDSGSQSREASRLEPELRTTVPTIAGPILIKNRRDLEQAHLIIAAPLVSATDERRYAADMLANIIGGGTSSRLWQKVREERGLAYNIGASALMYQDCGLFSVFAGTSPQQVKEVVDIVMAELRSILSDGVAADELELAKQQAISSVLLSLEDSASRAGAMAQSEMLHGRQITVEETMERIDLVTVEEITSLAREYFRTEAMAFAALGDLKGLKIKREDLTVN